MPIWASSPRLLSMLPDMVSIWQPWGGQKWGTSCSHSGRKWYVFRPFRVPFKQGCSQWKTVFTTTNAKDIKISYCGIIHMHTYDWTYAWEPPESTCIHPASRERTSTHETHSTFRESIKSTRSGAHLCGTCFHYWCADCSCSDWFC